MQISFTISGDVPSMKNSRIPTKWGGWIKSAEARNYEKIFAQQVIGSNKLKFAPKTHLRIAVWLYHKNWRRDVDIELVKDLLQKAGVIDNDRWLREFHVYGNQLDPKNPRVELTIQEIE